MQTDADERARLESVVPALERLARLLDAEQKERRQGIENFTEGDGLKSLEGLIDERRHEFDALDFVGRARLGSGENLWSDEEFQSNVLAWLLNANESHTAKTTFIGGFLSRTGAPKKLRQVDWSNSVVIREWENFVDGRQGFLDILVFNEQQGVLCAIENKVFSNEHSCQLTRYRRALESRYPFFEKHYVFLTPNGVCPHKPEDREYWKPVAYSTVLKEVQRIVENDTSLNDEDVRLFLKQYATTLRRNIVPDTSIPALAREIYLQHREAIETIYRHKPHYANETKQILKEAVSQLGGWRLEAEESSWIRFRPNHWAGLKHMETGTGAGSPGILLFFQFWFGQNYPTFGLWLAPSNDDDIRHHVVNRINQNPKIFNLSGSAYAEGWMNLHKIEGIVTEADLNNWDRDGTKTRIRAWIEDFAENEFPAMNNVIVRCFEEYEAEQRSGQ